MTSIQIAIVCAVIIVSIIYVVAGICDWLIGIVQRLRMWRKRRAYYRARLQKEKE